MSSPFVLAAGRSHLGVFGVLVVLVALGLLGGCTVGDPPAGGGAVADARPPEATQQVELPGASTAEAAAWQCPGGYGCPCAADGDCTASGLCLTHADNVKSCAVPCPAGVCDTSGTCRSVPAAIGPGPWCVPKAGRLCDPCATSDQCRDPGHPGAACVDYGAIGRFCGVACQGQSDCSPGYACEVVGSTDSGLVRQCVFAKGGALAECACSPRATADKRQTACGTGTCTGSRMCGEGGLTACDGLAPGPEVCNGKDDDCDGLTDEPIAGKTLCDDGKPCTTDVCDPVAGCQNLSADGTACNADATFCTGPDTCKAGACEAGPKLDCDDKIACTVDTCNPLVGCQHAWTEGTACDDGDGCTVSETCKQGACSGTAKPCDDKNPCTADVCLAGACTGTALDGAPCNDGNACTGADSCALGLCSGATATCDDGNACTADTCDKAKGCANLPKDPTACEDGNLCTSGDVCQAGTCAPGSASPCSTDNPCLLPVCSAASGACATKLRPDGAACNDGKPCTGGDACAKGLCIGKPSCDDGNACTADACGSDGNCAFAGQPSGNCDDGDKCTTGDTCAAGSCAGAAVLSLCDDHNPCTIDTCDKAAGCKHASASDGSPCDDALGCNGTDTCASGGCTQHTGVCKACASDGDCASEDDGNPCNGKAVCDKLVCSSDPKTVVVCDHAKDTACVVNTCDPKTAQCAAVTLADGATCSDGSACTGSDACKAAICVGTGGCDDGNPCTSDACGAQGCTHLPGAGTTCDDGNACTSGDACTDKAVCAGGPKVCNDGNSCTDDGCDPKTGCTAPHNTAACLLPGCKKGLCTAGTCADAGTGGCDDGNACTTDACQDNACKSDPAADGAKCDDGDACTGPDLCAAGKCKAEIAADAVTTLAGAGEAGFANGTGGTAKFTEPVALAIDASGTLYVADAASGGARIRKVSAEGAVTTFAGKGLDGFADGGPNTAQFWRPSGLAFGGDGALYVADRFNQRIRKIDAAGNVTTLAGDADAPGFGDPKALGDFADGQGKAAKFDEPAGIAWSAQDSALYVVEAANHRVRKVTLDGTVTLFAGKGAIGSADGDALQATFSAPSGIAVDGAGNVFVGDSGNHRIRKVSGGKVTTYAGSTKGYKDAVPLDSLWNDPAGLGFGNALLLVADAGNGSLRTVAFAETKTLAGNGTPGYAEGGFGDARFKNPRGAVVGGAGLWYVADTENFRVRKVYSPKAACGK
ncbi:MAG: hypothetical protein FJ100_09430 [Deltaproteobacteria bacterium]|nr:hypothetical protein [Deltaproteobacteria bacterium]